MKKRSKWTKRCSECGKVLRSRNESLLCEPHYREEYRRKNRDMVKLWARNSYERNKDEIIKKQTEYNQRPEIKLKRKECSKNYRERNKDKIREYEREYNQKPEVKLKRKEYLKKYNQIPEVKAKRRERDRIYNSIPKNRERKRIRDREYRARKKNEKEI